jgi:hypothetical protein
MTSDLSKMSTAELFSALREGLHLSEYVRDKRQDKLEIAQADALLVELAGRQHSYMHGKGANCGEAGCETMREACLRAAKGER